MHSGCHLWVLSYTNIHIQQKDPEADNDDFELHATVSVKVDATVHKGDIDVTVHKGDVDEWNGIEAREIAEVNARDSPFSTMNEEQVS